MRRMIIDSLFLCSQSAIIQHVVKHAKGSLTTYSMATGQLIMASELFTNASVKCLTRSACKFITMDETACIKVYADEGPPWCMLSYRRCASSLREHMVVSLHCSKDGGGVPPALLLPKPWISHRTVMSFSLAQLHMWGKLRCCFYCYTTGHRDHFGPWLGFTVGVRIRCSTLLMVYWR